LSEIFFSYAVEDLERVRPVVKALEEAGWTVWWDRSMLPGSRWQRSLRDAIQAARCVIVAWSSASIQSEWVEIEAEEGRHRGILVPILIDDVRPPFPFGGIQAARLLQWSGVAADREFQNLARAVGNVLGQPAQAPTIDSKAEAARKAEEERLAREKAEDARKAEQRRLSRERAAARRAEEARIAQEKEQAARKAEEERIAREQAERKAELARIAREKDAARKADADRIARANAEAVRKAEEARIAREKAAAARKAEDERIARANAEAVRKANAEASGATAAAFANCVKCGKVIHPDSTDCPFCRKKDPVAGRQASTGSRRPAVSTPATASRNAPAQCHKCGNRIHHESTVCPFCGKKDPIAKADEPAPGSLLKSLFFGKK
jgi:uncharacterized OB-fold protein